MTPAAVPAGARGRAAGRHRAPGYEPVCAAGHSRSDRHSRSQVSRQDRPRPPSRRRRRHALRGDESDAWTCSATTAASCRAPRTRARCRRRGRASFAGSSDRYSDAQLYALAQFIYSMTPPPNPNPFDARAKRGQAVFNASGCARCHTPPLYTANKLVPADGFTPPADHCQRYDILNARVGTDPDADDDDETRHGLLQDPVAQGRVVSRTVRTQRLGGHARRLVRSRRGCGTTTCRPASIGFGVKTRAVKGHPFGLNLSAADRAALSRSSRRCKNRIALLSIHAIERAAIRCGDSSAVVGCVTC